MRISEKYDDELYNTESHGHLLNTIKVPLNLHYLTDQLPGPNYDPLDNAISPSTEYISKTVNSKKRSVISNKENKKSIKGSRESSLEPSKPIPVNYPLVKNKRKFAKSPSKEYGIMKSNLSRARALLDPRAEALKNKSRKLKQVKIPEIN